MDKSLPGPDAYEKVLLGLGSSAEMFRVRYSTTIEALVNKRTNFQALLSADVEDDVDIFHQLFSEIEKNVGNIP